MTNDDIVKEAKFLLTHIRVIEHHFNGQIMFDGYVNTEGELNGECITWWPNHQKWEESNYADGLLHGEHKLWDTCGKLIAHCKYENGHILKDYLK